tara:strand:- start:1054 stop:1356 length:303 start_codon:yes stop_codon:yes gene_type:complete
MVAGCASSGNSYPPDVPEKGTLVSQDDLAFSPKKLKVRVGEPIYFWNAETSVHNLVFDKRERSPNMEAGDVFVWSFDTPGEYIVTCDYHPQMRLQITVKP